jgi:O-antigen/teichoic acid export membrane protein
VTKAIEMARVSAKGGFNLFWGLAASTIISSVGVILVARLLSPSEYGLVTIASTAPNLIILFRDWGVNSAIIKYTAQYRSENKTTETKAILAAGLLFELALGVSLSLISFLLSGFLATDVFHRPDIKPLIEIASFTVFGTALTMTAQSAFTGYEKMELSSITMICRSAFKTILAPLLVILGLGAFGAIVGYTAAFLGAGLISIVLLYITLYSKLRALNDDKLEIVKTLKTMFKYGLPLSISTIIAGLLLQFYNFLIAIYCTDPMIGNYSVTLNFAVLITFFSVPIATVLFPAFSKLSSQKERQTLRNVFQHSVKYAALLVVPAAALVMALSKPIVFTLFGEKYSHAPLFLTMYAITFLYSAFGNLSIGNLINSQGKTKVTSKLALIHGAIGFPLSLLLIPKFGIIGLIVTTLTAGIPSMIIGLWWVKKHFTATIDWISSAKILFASTLASVTAYIIASQLNIPNWIELAVGTTAFLATYTITTPLVGAINKTDIKTLKEMLKEFGPLFRVFNFPLNIIEKLTFTQQKEEATN